MSQSFAEQFCRQGLHDYYDWSVYPLVCYSCLQATRLSYLEIGHSTAGKPSPPGDAKTGGWQRSSAVGGAGPKLEAYEVVYEDLYSWVGLVGRIASSLIAQLARLRPLALKLMPLDAAKHRAPRHCTWWHCIAAWAYSNAQGDAVTSPVI